MVQAPTERRATTEKSLVHQVRQGSQEAFCQLVERYQDRLLSRVRSLMDCRADAEDVVQDAFLQAYTKFDSFRGESSFYTWLYRIAMNMAISRNRKVRITTMSLDKTLAITGNEPLDPHEGPDMRLERLEKEMQIQQALKSLSDEHYAILMLRGLDRLDYETIAEQLSVKPGTVRSRLHRARTRFREELDEREQRLMPVEA